MEFDEPILPFYLANFRKGHKPFIESIQSVFQTNLTNDVFFTSALIWAIRSDGPVAR